MIRMTCPDGEHDPPIQSVYDEANGRWRRVVRDPDAWRLLRGDVARSYHLPDPITGDDLTRAVATLLHPRTRALLARLLLDALWDLIAERVRCLLAKELPGAVRYLLKITANGGASRNGTTTQRR
jgi:hypothetical protein